MIFDYGTEGDKFYIILSGSVNIWVPFFSVVNKEEKERRKKLHDK